MFVVYGKRIDCRGPSQPPTKDRFIINALRADRYLISSSSQYYGHPDADTIELILRHYEGGQPELEFDYLSPRTQPWGDDTLQQERGYKASFPSDASWGVQKMSACSTIIDRRSGNRVKAVCTPSICFCSALSPSLPFAGPVKDVSVVSMPPVVVDGDVALEPGAASLK